MKNMIRMWMIAALLAVIGFSMAGCSSPTGGGPSGGDPELSGTITISPSTDVTTGKELTATYSGSEEVSYQWNKGGTAVPGATSAKYTPAEAGSYTVTVSADGFKPKTSAAVEVTGDKLETFTVTFNSGGGGAVPSQTVTKGAKVIEPQNATRSGHTLAGWYKEAAFTNQWNFATDTVTANITLYAKWNQTSSGGPPGGDPELSGTLTISAEGDSFTINTELTATYSGSETVTYQWYKGGTAISGATSAKYIPTEAGRYTVTVSATGYNSKTSDHVDVTDPSLGTLSGDISISPSTGVTTGTELTATYTGNESVTYGWEKDDTAIPGVTTNTYTPTAAGSYTVTVSADGYNPKTSAAVTVTADAGSDIPIANAEISITAPVYGATPHTTATGTGEFTTGAVSWSPAHSPFQGGTVYTATVTLTANSGHTFTDSTEAKINGGTATVSSNTGAAVTLSHTFPATGTKLATALTINAQPTKLIYTHGEQLDLTGLAVTLTFNDGSTEVVAAEDFADLNITADPAHGDHLVHLTHNGHPVTIEYGVPKANTNNLTVNAKAVTLTVDATIAAVTYNGSAHTPTSVVVKDGATTLTPVTDYTIGHSNNTNAGTATVTITGAGNYAGSTGSVNFTINKATGAAVSAPAAATIGVDSVTLTAVTAPTNGQTVEYSRSDADSTTTNGTWQPGTTFSELIAGTTYYFFARSAGNANYETGTASGSTAVTTKQEAEFEITFTEIADAALDDIVGLALSKSGTATATLTVTSPTQYSSIEWYIDGSLRRTGSTLNLNAANYSLGSHTITLNVVKGGVSYNRTITFTVEN